MTMTTTTMDNAQERYKLDMDEGPERARLRLRPNHAFYDTYEVLAPASSSAKSFLKADTAGNTTTTVEAPPSPAADTEVESYNGAVVPGMAAAASTLAETAAAPIPATIGTPPSVQMASPASDGERGPVAPGMLTADGPTGATVVVAGEGSTAAAVANVATVTMDEVAAVDSDTDPMPTVVSAESGSSVAAIAALVKTMSERVGVGKDGRTRKNPLASVFDLDDTDTFALLELEESVSEEEVSKGAGGGRRTKI